MAKKDASALPALLSIQDIIGDVLTRDPIYFTETVRTVKGDNFKIVDTGRDYLVEVFNYICHEALRKSKPLVVVKGRQVEFTETMLNVCLYYLYHMKNITILYAFPSGDQVRRFSSDRFDGAIRESQNEVLKNIFLRGGKQNVHHKQFKNNCQIFMYSAWGNADTLRGITCDVLVKDEVQDWTRAGIENTREAMTQSKYKIDLSIGTPKAEGSYYHKIWEDSDKRYFHVKCINCDDLFRITMNVCKRGTIIECPKCKTEQEKKLAIKGGRWIPMAVDPENATYVGFHLSQLMHPNITIEEILRKQKSMSERSFKNEVLGEFTGTTDRPLTPQEIIDIIERERWNEPQWDYPETIAPPEQTVMGIDWGGHSEDKPRGSYNALVIVKPLSYAKYQIVYSQKIMHSNYKKQVEEIKDLIYKYNCQAVVADIGYGHVQIQMLQEEFGKRIVSCSYGTNLKVQYKLDQDLNTISVDKDFALEELYKEIKEKQWIIPLISNSMLASEPDAAEGNDYEWLIHHICNIELKDIVRGGNTRKSFQKINRPCDGLHALNYARIALIMKGHIIRQQNVASSSYAPRPVLARFGRR